MEDLFAAALKFLYERRLVQLGIQADITVTKKEAPINIQNIQRRAAA